MGKGLSRLVNRMLVGAEKSEGYARASLPANRWELFWDIFKGRFWKIVLINLLVLLFNLPLFLFFYAKDILIAGYGSLYPFSQGFGIGYGAPTSMVGYEQNIVLNVNMSVNFLLPVVLIISAIGIAGGAYVMRNMVWTEGIFVANDFWHGVKKNFKQVLFVCLIFSCVYYLIDMATALADQNIVLGVGPAWLLHVFNVLSYIILVLFFIMCAHMVTMCVTYEYTLGQLIKNSFLFTIGLLPQNLLFAFLGSLCFIMRELGSIFYIISFFCIILFGLSLFLLVWTNFSQWAFDKYINEKIGAKKNRGIYEKVKNSNSAALQQYKQQQAIIKTSLNSKPIKPITDEHLRLAELPPSFNRKDIEKLNQSRKELYADNEQYILEHKNDQQFKQFEEKTSADKEREKRIEKAKKELAKRNKHN